ncbi:hypothetical protein ACSQ9Q_20910, partial [Salmonella enterica]
LCRMISKCEWHDYAGYLHTHTKFWKFYEARPSGKVTNFKGKYCGYVEGFDGYLYNQEWVKKILSTYADSEELNRVQG